MSEFDISNFLDVLGSGDVVLIATAIGLALLILGLKLAGKKVPVLSRVSNALLQLSKLSKAKPGEKPALPAEEKAPAPQGVAEVIEIKKLDQ